MKILLAAILIAILIVTGCSDPSDREQIKAFMLADNTSEHSYTSDYMCGSFARSVVENAREQGFDAYRVIMEWEGCTSHAIVLFKTRSGDVYVDATCGDWWVEMKDGKYYSWSMENESIHSFYNMDIIEYFIDERL